MNGVNEAAKIAAEENKLMIRKSVSEVFNGITGAIKPTNSYETCQLYVIYGDGTKKCARCWNPSLDDLTADDWMITYGQKTTQRRLTNYVKPFSGIMGRTHGREPGRNMKTTKS